MGGMISASTLTAVLSHCSGKKNESFKPGLQFFSNDQFNQLNLIVERIIPATETPGAIEAKVPEFIDMMLAECYEKDQQTLFTDGLNTFLATLGSQNDKAIIQQQLVDFEAKHRNEEESNPSTFFIRTVKELTLLGFFTSREGATESLQYVPIPSRFDACVPYEGERAFSVN